MKKCPYCGFANDDRLKVCQRCKAQVPHEEKKLSENTNMISAGDEATNHNGEETLRVSRKKTKE